MIEREKKGNIENQNREDISNIDIHSLQWENDNGDEIESNVKYDSIAKMKILFKNKEFDLTITQEENKRRHLFRFYLSLTDKKIAKGYIIIEKQTEGYAAETGVARLSDENDTKGVVLLLYTKLITNILQTKANEIESPIIHTTERSEDYPRPNHGMTAEDWTEKFDPIFKKLGYKKITECVWRKEYTPISQSPSLST